MQLLCKFKFGKLIMCDKRVWTCVWLFQLNPSGAFYPLSDLLQYKALVS
jgi:hypothetical protein